MDNRAPTRRRAGIDLMRTILVSTVKVVAIMGAIGLTLFFLHVWRVSYYHNLAGRQRGYLAGMKYELRELATDQESYYADHSTYAPSLSELGEPYQSSTGVSIALDVGTPDGWKASASHEISSWRCVLFGGDVESPHPEAQEGYPYCWDPSEVTSR